MELPIAPQQGQPSTAALVRAVRRSEAALARTASTETTLDGAVAFANPDRPGVRCVNFAAGLAPAQHADADSLVAGIHEHFDAAGAPCHTLDAAAIDWPDALADVIRRRAYRPITRHVFLMTSYRPPEERGTGAQIIPARAAYRELTQLYDTMARLDHHADDALAAQLIQTMIDRLDEPRLDLFLARLDRRPVAVAGVVSLGNMGVVSSAYADPAYRGRGLAKTLMTAVLDHCVRAQFEQVIVDRSDGCPSIPFYQSLGFERATSYTKYLATMVTHGT